MIQKLLPVLFLASLGFAIGGVQASVSADTVPVAGQNYTATFACLDGTGEITTANTADASKHKYVRITCKSGALFDYLHYNDPALAATETTVTSVYMACPAPLSISGTPDHLNQSSSQYLIYCKKFTSRDSDGIPQYTFTDTYATRKSTQTRDNTADGTTPGLTTNQSRISGSSLPQVSASQDTITNILKLLFGIIGGAAVLVVVIGGMRYVFANGDPSQVTQAKNTILYAIVGLVVAMAGYSIVAFVVKNI